MIDQMYDNVFVINLDRRPDRMQEVKAELEKVGIQKYERISAVDGKSLGITNSKVAIGNVGCSLSHLKVVKLAKERGYKNYVVFEDDVVFKEDFNNLFKEQVQQIPAGWDCIFLGGSHVRGLERVTENVSRMLGSYTTHAMIINHTLYDKLIEVWEAYNTTKEVDVAMASLHRPNKCYTFTPPLAWQRAGHSDILERFDDYKHLR